MSVKNTTASGARRATTRVQSLLEGSLQAAKRATQFLGTMAAAGMGVDTSPPDSSIHFPFYEKDDRAEDEDEYEESVDNSFDYTPAPNEFSDDGEDAGNVRGVVQRETVEQVVLEMQEDVSMEEVAEVLGEVEVERRAVFQETTVVKKYSHPESDEEQKGEVSDGEQQHNELMAFALRPLTAVVDPIACNEAVDSRGEKEELSLSMTSVPSDEQLESANAVVDMNPSDEVVSETPPSVDTAHDADDGKNDASDGRQGEQQKPASVPPPPDSPPPTASNDTTKGPESSKAEVQTANARKRALEVSSPGVNQETGQDDGLTSPVKTVVKPPAHTPKHSKQAASKKRKKSPHPLHSANSSNNDSQWVRRSSRAKRETPRFPYSAQSLPDETAMAHFDRDTVANALNPVRQSRVAPMASMPAVNPDVITQEIASASVEMPLVKLMGSQELADKLQHSVGFPFTGDAPIERFQDMIEDDVVGLRHLQVQNLLDALGPLDGPVVLLHAKLPGVERSTGQDAVAVSTAKARSLEKCPLRFPAPRDVGDKFIFPLAEALGLGYALKKHRAKLVSCPQGGMVLDWRFHKTETVAFQLKGETVWKVKKSQVEHPVQCFHPQSWSFDDVAHTAKLQRVASADEGSVGFLVPPGADVDVFDEHHSGDGVTGQLLEFLLKPGSVAYVPDGTWFEIETRDADALWLEVQLASMMYEELMFSASRQLAWKDKQSRMPVRIRPGAHTQTKQIRQQTEVCLKSLRRRLGQLEGSDLLPEYLVTDDLQALVAEGVVRDTSTSPNGKSLEVDLTDSRLKLEHSKKLSPKAGYRVNPVAVLMSADEIPHLSAHEDEPHVVEVDRASSSTMKPPQALKKTPKPKPKRKPKLRAISNTSKHTYVLDTAFGNDRMESQLHVKFQCSGEQAKMVEWLRSRGTEPFDLKGFIAGQRTPESKIPEKKARALLRFMHFVGYVSELKST